MGWEGEEWGGGAQSYLPAQRGVLDAMRLAQVARLADGKGDVLTLCQKCDSQNLTVSIGLADNFIISPQLGLLL